MVCSCRLDMTMRLLIARCFLGATKSATGSARFSQDAARSDSQIRRSTWISSGVRETWRVLLGVILRGPLRDGSGPAIFSPMAIVNPTRN